MKFCLRIVLLVLLISGTLMQDDFDLSDVLDGPDTVHNSGERVPTTKKPRKPSPVDSYDLADALEPDTVHNSGERVPTTKKPRKPSPVDSYDLADALEPDTRSKSEPGGGTIDSDLFDITGSDYKPDRGRSGGPEKPTDKPSGGDCQGNVVQKLDKIIENQNEQLRLLLQLVGQSASSRSKRMH